MKKPSPSSILKKSFRSPCPINHSVETFCDAWSLVIIRDMLFQGKKSYGEFIESPERISTNILATRLEKLQSSGLIEKWPDKLNRRKFVYLLTDRGIALAPVLVEMALWGADQSGGTAIPAAHLEKFRKDKDRAIAPVVARYRRNKATFFS